MRKLPVLSLWRPWPAMVFHAGKDLENRMWPTTYRGDLLIHGARGCDRRALSFARGVATRKPGTDTEPKIDLTVFPEDPDEHPTGIVGVVELHAICTYAFAHPGEQCACSGWANLHQMHWQLRNPRVFTQPVQHPGKQRLWQVTDALWPAVAEQLAAVDRLPTYR